MSRDYCLNCETKLPIEAKHCSNCGQSIKDYDISLKSVFTELFNNIFNLDSRFFNTIKNIWKPHFLTKEYIAGRRKKYLLPIQTFLFLLFFQITLVLYYVDFSKASSFSHSSNAEAQDLIKRFDTISVYAVPDKKWRDSLRVGTFKTFLDTSEQKFPQYTPFRNRMQKYGVTYKDVYSKSIDSIFKEKKITDWRDQKMISQSIKFELNPIGTIKFFISNLTWILLFTILGNAFIAKLLYIRSGFYYIEHFTLSLYLHSAFLLFSSLFFWGINLLGFDFETIMEDLGDPVSIFIFSYLVVIAYLFYGQSLWKFAIKYFITIWTYFIFLLIMGIFVLLINYLFFI